VAATNELKSLTVLEGDCPIEVSEEDELGMRSHRRQFAGDHDVIQVKDRMNDVCRQNIPVKEERLESRI